MILLGVSASLAGTVAALELVVTPIGDRSAVLALVVGIALVVAAWGFGAFRSDTPRLHRPVSRFIERVDGDHPDALGSLDRRERWGAASAFFDQNHHTP